MSGRGQGGKGGGPPPRFPAALKAVLPDDTYRAWQTLAPHLPAGLYLGGGTAVAVWLHHRESRDLDFFFHDDAVDLKALRKTITKLGKFAVTHDSEGTLKGFFGSTKIEIFNASALKRLRPTQEVAGLQIASLEDLIAMKIKVMAERGEMRDYFDVKEIDEGSALSLEEGIGLYIERYNVDPASGVLQHLYLAMGNLTDVEEDQALPITKAELEAWWRKRQVKAARNSNWFR